MDILALLLKMMLTASLVVTAAYVAERMGPAIGGVVATLPITAGPAYAFMALDHDAAFIHQSSLASLAMNALSAVLVTVYVALAPRSGFIVSLTAAVLSWVVLAAAANALSLSFEGAIVLNLILYGLGLMLTRKARLTSVPGRRGGMNWTDVLLRAVLVAVLVGVVLLVARYLGPHVAGIVAVYPIGLTSLIVVAHPRMGGAATALVLANTLWGLAGFSVGLAMLYLGIPPFGVLAALLAALMLCIAWNGVLYLAVRRRSRLQYVVGDAGRYD